jgi:hypothetical protein
MQPDRAPHVCRDPSVDRDPRFDRDPSVDHDQCVRCGYRGRQVTQLQSAWLARRAGPPPFVCLQLAAVVQDPRSRKRPNERIRTCMYSFSNVGQNVTSG